MHGSREDNARRFLTLRDSLSRSLTVLDVAVCVPFPYIGQAESELQESSIAWGVQDVSAHPEGAFTGEVSAAMVGEFGCRYVIVGHSERRTCHGEDSTVIAAKAKRAIGSGLAPILCVGESLVQRESGMTTHIVSTQIGEVFDQLSVDECRQVTVAYEPVWAIGTGRTATPSEVQMVHGHIRQVLSERDPYLAALRLLYGGSVKASNAEELLSLSDVDGALVGGASLDADEFSTICLFAEKAPKTTDGRPALPHAWNL